MDNSKIKSDFYVTNLLENDLVLKEASMSMTSDKIKKGLETP